MHPVSSLSGYLHPIEVQWYAIRTRFKCEKFVQHQLARKSIHAYVPLQHFVRRYQRKIRSIEIPLISCYVFVRINRQDYVKVLETEHVCGFVRQGQTLSAIPDNEIQILRRVTMEPDLDVEVLQEPLTIGHPVEIIAGNLTGLRGRIVARESRQRLQVELQTLGFNLLLTVDEKLLTLLRLTQ